MEYIALDFETANRYPESACSIGMSLMDEEGSELDRYYSLICPPVLYFDPVCTSVHHLREAEVKRAPTFKELWPEISSFIGTRPLVAHNARFDISVLNESALAYGIVVPNYEYYCSMQITRKLVKGYSSYSLSYIVPELLGFNYNAHLASDDAYACGRLFAFVCKGHLNEKEELETYMRLNKCAYPKTIRKSEDVLLF